jgi:ATP-dependent Clp protease ATP-binding subunit ClpC
MDGKHREATNPADVPLSVAVLQLIADAKDESARLRHEYIGTEHLVLALSRQAGDVAPLPALAVDPQRVCTRISEIIQRGSIALRPDLERPFTSRTKSALALAAESARQLGHTHLGVAHLLVGLMRERMNIGAQVLADEGLTVERAYDYARQNSASG